MKKNPKNLTIDDMKKNFQLLKINLNNMKNFIKVNIKNLPIMI